LQFPTYGIKPESEKFFTVMKMIQEQASINICTQSICGHEKQKKRKGKRFM